MAGCDAAKLLDQFEPTPEAEAAPVSVIDSAANWVGARLELEGDARVADARHVVIVRPGRALHIGCPLPVFATAASRLPAPYP